MINVTAYKARQGTSKAGKPYFQQVLEIPQEGRPSAQITRFSSDQSHVLAEGAYTAKVRLYQKQFTLADGKTVYELVSSLYDFTPVK